VRKLNEAEILRLAVNELSDDDFDAIDAAIHDHVLDLRFRIPGRLEIFGARIPLVESELPMPFVYAVPEDETDFLDMLRIWIDEEIATGCANWAVINLEDSVSYFEMAPYGFRRKDQNDDVRLASSATGSWDNSSVAEEMRGADN